MTVGTFSPGYSLYSWYSYFAWHIVSDQKKLQCIIFNYNLEGCQEPSWVTTDLYPQS